MVQSPEECDDTNDSNTDACLKTCIDAVCGDGYVWEGNEACDDGNTNPWDDCSDNCLERPASMCSSSRSPAISASFFARLHFLFCWYSLSSHRCLLWGLMFLGNPYVPREAPLFKANQLQLSDLVKKFGSPEDLHPF